MPEAWLDILRARVAAEGQAAVAQTLGVARSAISMVLNGKYPAATHRLARKVLAAYGQKDCPILGAILPATCTTHAQAAKRLGLVAGNPQTLRLRKACLTCQHNGGDAA